MDVIEDKYSSLQLSSKIPYSEQEHLVWYELYKYNKNFLTGLAHPNFFENLEEINLPVDRIPQLHEISKILEQNCGWQLAPVAGIIPPHDFYSLLAKKIFPSTISIRQEVKTFLREPDIFHELFGHATMLVNEKYAKFLNIIANIALNCSPLQQAVLQRLIWFTIEVGLIATTSGIRIYGGALLSSPAESTFSLQTKKLQKIFDIVKIFRSPFQIDSFQEHYYILDSFDDLLNIDLSLHNLNVYINSCKELGEYPTAFTMKEDDKYSSVGIFQKYDF